MRLTLAAALTGFLAPAVIVALVNWLGDPYQYYHPNAAAASHLSTNERWQNAGLIKHYPYDTLIVGTSRSQNFMPEMFDPAGWHVLKATMAGSSAGEQLDVVEFALRQHRARRLLLELSYTGYMRSALDRPDAFPGFLYHPGMETPFLYLLSADLFGQVIDLRLNRTPPRGLKRLNVWYDRNPGAFDAARVRGLFDQKCEASPAAPGANDMDANLARLERLVTAHRETQFIGYLPPFPALELRVASPGTRASRLAFRTRLAVLDERLGNLTVFDFASSHDIVLDLGRYKDLTHYDMDVNRLMAAQLSAGTAPRLDPAAPNRRLLELAAIAAADLPDGCRVLAQR